MPPVAVYLDIINKSHESTLSPRKEYRCDKCGGKIFFHGDKPDGHNFNCPNRSK